MDISAWFLESKKMTVYAQRRKRLLSLARGKQVVTMTAANTFWLTDFWGGGAAIVLPDKTVVVTSPLEADRAEEEGEEVEVVVVKGWKDIPHAIMKRLRGHRAVTDDDSLLRRFAGFRADPSLFHEGRRVKDAIEVERIRRASRGLDKIFETMPHELREGKSEREVAAEIMKSATRLGLTPSGSDSALSPVIVASGANGALPHSELTGRRLKRGDVVVVDIFFRFEGYNSDATRTFAIGTASAEMKRNYSAVREAQAKALEVATTGAVCSRINEAAVSVLRESGLDRLLNHSVGHGVGIDIHELPSISKGSKTRLVDNDVVTDEPGVYFPGKYGIRIEDTLVVGPRSELLTRFTKDLITCG
ncbi:MAG: M24 family metallopeptidase [Thaumarchaeota archaeon]|nr:M24 family metallopeptidase [Nitrososphaerota archaeon]